MHSEPEKLLREKNAALQKELAAKNRELEIEAALERVRARTMSMQKSDELTEAANLLFQQIQTLGMPAWSAGYCIMDEDKQCVTIWMSTEGVLQPPFRVPLTEEASFIRMREAYERGETFYVEEVGGEELITRYQYLRTLPVAGGILDSVIEAGHPLPTLQIFHFSSFSHGFLVFITYEPVPEAHDIFKRFGRVFEQTYTRFLDLQRAEAQTREAMIEAALERVRSRSMAMHKSDEVMDVAVTVYDQLQKLDFNSGAATIIIMDEKTGNMEHWLAGFLQKNHVDSYEVNKPEHPLHAAQLAAWRKGEKFVSIEMSGAALKGYAKEMFSQTGYKKLPEEEKAMLSAQEHAVFNLAYMKHGALMWAPTAISDENAIILQRFAKVFEQTYTRFLDLQKAEELAREAQIQLALERVRARTMAMQKSDELTDVAAVLFQQVDELGIKVWTTGFNVWSEDNNYYTDYITSPSGGFIEPYTIEATGFPAFKEISDARKRGEEFYVSFLEGEMLKKTYQELGKFGDQKQYEKMLEGGFEFPTHQFNHFVFGSKVSLLFITYEPVPEAHDIFKRFGKVFEQTYTRFLDLQKAEAQAVQAQLNLIQIQTEKKRAENALVELQQTQRQLIQAEKMASLGELTAGIAHEIQNPLNFVNNFSEINKELIEELEQANDNGNEAEVKAIAAGIKENEQKIAHHGKRADAIVKGMLQHSRQSTGQKESTDMNALADEYLRLSYHGFRAKDKSFNITIETTFDESIRKIEVVPQEIGRVLLNLFNNAFYAAQQKKQQFDGSLIPIVSVSTKKLNDKIEIRVKDNGNGIPEKIKDKIFQPFFTTKPTGVGTGLGLSLSYDIIKAHGGEIQVETKEGEFAEFIIILPKQRDKND